MIDAPSSKKILFNKSTLLSLKAELLKKQGEVSEKKELPQHKLENFKPAVQQRNKKSSNSEQRTFKERLTETDTDELEACRKSKAALKKKAELYDHLSDSAGTSQLAEHFLVDFNLKKQQEPATEPAPKPEDNIQQVYSDEEEWMEYTDCLDRTHKCLKADLELYKRRDEQLMHATMKGLGKKDPENEVYKDSEKTLLVQKTNDYLHSLRMKWEKKEEELLSKEKDIHYQDVLFDEARIHGVSYYSFSTDEAERQKQMRELKRTREETLRAQQQAEEQRKKRDEQIAARVAAARARQRIRAGLPPEDPNEKKNDFTKCLLEFLTSQRKEAEDKSKEEEKILKEEQEKERAKLREAYIREWDVGKEGVGDGKREKFRLMSQEEYVEQQRAKRIEEFAPTNMDFNDKNQKSFDTSGRLAEKTWADVRPQTATATVTEETSKGLYFSSIRKEPMKYKNFNPVPIDNELESDNRKEENDSGGVEKKMFKEFAPPPTYEYYGPVPKRFRSEKPFDSNIEEAYEHGVKLLHMKEEGVKVAEEYNFIL